MPVFFFTVEQQERAIVERFGKFVRVAGPGLQTKTPFVTREPDQRVKDAMNNINASQRNQVAAAAQGDAQKTLAVKKAEGERETMRLQGEGVAAERKAIAEGSHESLEIIAQHGLDPKEAMASVALTEYTDMIRALAEGSNTNMILLPHSPSSVGDIMSQIRDRILIADVATETNTQPRAIAPREQAA